MSVIGSIKAEVDPEYVVVTRSLDDDSERIELPTNSDDNSLGLPTLIGAFPGAHGLKYKNPATGAFRAVLIDPSGTKFHPPVDGWSNKVFVVLSQPQPVAESVSKNAIKKSDQNAKRRKLMVESDDENNSCESDTDHPIGGEGRGGGGGHKYEASGASKRQQSATKQKRMMAGGKEGPPIRSMSGDLAPSSEANNEAEEEIPDKIIDLLVMGLPFELTEDELRAHFETFGKVVHTEIKTQRGHTTNRGFGFVQMADLDAQTRILKQKIHVIGNRECQVKIPFTKNPLSSKIFVGRIKESMSVIDLRKYFTEQAHKIDPDSSVTDVYIPRPFRSFAFVTFSSPIIAKELIKIGELNLDDCPLTISSAHSTRPQQDAHHGNHQPISPFIHPPRPPFPPFQSGALDQHNRQFSEDAYSHDWYNNYGTTPGIPQSRTAGPMFSAAGPNYQQNSSGNPYNVNPPVAAGSQMLNQLETLNLNNIGMPQLSAAIKALVAAASTHPDGGGGGGGAIMAAARGMPSAGGGVYAHQPHQQQAYPPRYQSMSPPAPPGTSTTASRSPVYQQQHGGQAGSGGGRRNGGGGSASGWR